MRNLLKLRYNGHLETTEHIVMIYTIFIFGLGGPELIIVALVVLLMFGGKKLPELMKGLGSGIREFNSCLLYTSPSPRDRQKSRMPSSA